MTSQDCPTLAPIVVLDTNIVLAWLVFGDADGLEIGRMITGGEWQWHATPEMRAELGHVIRRETLTRWRPDHAAILTIWERHCLERSAPHPTGQTPATRCTDPDDQKFIDLAVAVRATWLFSRDAAVLKLAGRLRPLGVTVASRAPVAVVTAA